MEYLVTHEHSYYVQGLGTFAKKFNLPVFVNQKTLDAMPKQKEKILEKNINLFNIDENFEIGDFNVKPFQFHMMLQILVVLIFLKIIKK